MTFKVVYHSGAFIPEGQISVPEGTQGTVVLDMHDTPAAFERKRILARLVEEMRQNALPTTSPRFTRADLHERG